MGDVCLWEGGSAFAILLVFEKERGKVEELKGEVGEEKASLQPKNLEIFQK